MMTLVLDEKPLENVVKGNHSCINEVQFLLYYMKLTTKARISIKTCLT